MVSFDQSQKSKADDNLLHIFLNNSYSCSYPFNPRWLMCQRRVALFAQVQFLIMLLLSIALDKLFFGRRCCQFAFKRKFELLGMMWFVCHWNFPN